MPPEGQTEFISEIWGLSRFQDPEYLQRRTDVEKNIRNEFISRGGRPELINPIYFFLGRNPRFEENKNNKAYCIDLKDLNIETVTFTYGDSLLAYDSDYKLRSGVKYQNSKCGKIFLLNELDTIQSSDLHIEVQLWIAPHPNIVKELNHVHT